MGGRTWDGFFRTVLLDAEDVVNSAACLQVSLATLGFPQASRSPYFPFVLLFSLSVSQISISFPASTHHAPLPSRVSVLYSANIPAEKPPCGLGWAKDRVPITRSNLAYAVAKQLNRYLESMTVGPHHRGIPRRSWLTTGSQGYVMNGCVDQQ